MNAIIMAAGTSSRFVPLCWERPKGLLEVKGEILIERQIKQLKAAGVNDITIVTGYMAEKFNYLKDKFGVSLVYNQDYARYNNTSTLMCVLNKLGDTWICSSDNYFTENVFDEHPVCSQYSAEYADGETDEYCLTCDKDNNIINVTVGSANAWYMIGHVYLSKDFSVAFKKILVEEYKNEETRQGYWEDVYIKHLKELPLMKIRKFEPGIINEFDSLKDLRTFDKSYIDDTKSVVIKELSKQLNCEQFEILNIRKYREKSYKFSFIFFYDNDEYLFLSNKINGSYELHKL
ncbi:MAG: NTP transferase domain-containing protein [Prevotella sp.]|nr:NTP transferase domain-containing protein [Prevotella sp.]